MNQQLLPCGQPMSLNNPIEENMSKGYIYGNGRLRMRSCLGSKPGRPKSRSQAESEGFGDAQLGVERMIKEGEKLSRLSSVFRQIGMTATE